MPAKAHSMLGTMLPLAWHLIKSGNQFRRVLADRLPLDRVWGEHKEARSGGIITCLHFATTVKWEKLFIRANQNQGGGGGGRGAIVQRNFNQGEKGFLSERATWNKRL